MSRIVHIKWMDSHSYSRKPWALLEEVLEVAKPIICESVGFLLNENDASVTVAAHQNAGNVYDPSEVTSVSGDMTIPRSAIVSMVEWPKKRTRKK